METTNLEFQPKVFAQKCPVCNGYGTVNYGKKTCHGCSGRGFIVLPATEKEGEDGNGKYK